MKNSHNIIAYMKQRGLIADVSGEQGELDAWLHEAPRTIYYGFDPTADSLHVGHAVPLAVLRHLSKAGHTVIILAGGATGMIGDPSGRSEERVMMSEETIQKNAVIVTQQIKNILKDDSVIYVNNYDWYKNMNSLSFLRDIGKLVSVHSLLKRESVEIRLQSENFFSYTELSYSLLQGYDFAYLAEYHNCSVQVGGGDQWGNMLMGTDFSKKMFGKQAFALATPLLVDSKTGKKFGKSEGNAIWLDREKATPYTMYQFFLQISDEDTALQLNIFTDKTEDEIADIMQQHEVDPSKRIAQHTLAYGALCIFHTEQDAIESQRASELLFGGTTLNKISSQDIEILQKVIPMIEIEPNQTLVSLLTESGTISSKREVLQLVDSKGLSINNEIVTDATTQIAETSLLKKGKKDYFLVFVKN